LFADQLQLPHQASHLEPPNLLAVCLHHRHDAAATGGASTLRKQFVNPAAQPKPLNVWSSAPETVGVVTRTSDIKDCAKPINRLLGAQLINQRVRSCSSDIKSAVALIEHEACGLAFEFSGKRTTLFGHQTPLSGEHSRLNGCPVSLDNYMCGARRPRVVK